MMSEIIKIDNNLYEVLKAVKKEQEDKGIPFTFSQAIREIADKKLLAKYSKNLEE